MIILKGFLINSICKIYLKMQAGNSSKILAKSGLLTSSFNYETYNPKSVAVKALYLIRDKFVYLIFEVKITVIIKVKKQSVRDAAT